MLRVCEARTAWDRRRSAPVARPLSTSTCASSTRRASRQRPPLRAAAHPPRLPTVPHFHFLEGRREHQFFRLAFDSNCLVFFLNYTSRRARERQLAGMSSRCTSRPHTAMSSQGKRRAIIVQLAHKVPSSHLRASATPRRSPAQKAKKPG